MGDLLVTSDKEGIAMGLQPLIRKALLFNARALLIDKALEPIEKGVGEILVLLSLQ